ncbi:hypothetical protein GlitD10_0434 [Gloeomargarita lithophora Alchichica-D10]|uniref:Pvc16 N-terminal domain-containing protein n=1 Tax=Gloeomargarita lithophora Alchichica-D10 TaxID=1188229 RepID=A0A1J0AA20_9CYAN|nr:DUF4255 domain-containing protein [Gloeomargarita lithophora]APB32745.1 hypothetical protein GlitD10_0434 [Gloeomargarita lithophora Alchichica-D10]
MSNYLGIATVTATLQRLLQGSVQLDVAGARVTTVRPETLGQGGTPEAGVNLFLYQISPNPAWANNNIPPRQRKGEVTKRGQAPLDLHYLLSFYGNEVELEPQRLLGSVVRTLEDFAILTPQMLAQTIQDPGFPYLEGADLADQNELVKAEPLNLELNDLANLWSTFFQAPYILSMAYKVSVVLIEGEEPGRRALPVRSQRSVTQAFNQQPVIVQVRHRLGAREPVTRSSPLLILGRNLQGGSRVQVRLGEILVTPQELSSTQIALDLSQIENLPAGMLGVQVVHIPAPQQERGELGVGENLQTVPRPPRVPWVESNVEALILRPTVVDLETAPLPPAVNGASRYRIAITTDVPIQPTQKVVLVLNQRAVSAPALYLFDSEPHATVSTTIEVIGQGLQSGHYLARLMVAGAESLLTVDTDPDSPTFEQYIAPLVVIP